MDSAPKDPKGRIRLWENPVTVARQKKRLAKRKQERQNKKKGR